MKKFALNIPKPCHEDWSKMRPEDKGRYCGACQKTVIDCRDMSDRQLVQFFRQPLTNVCGHFHADQLNRSIELPRKKLPWIKYFFTISLPAFMLSLKASAQKEIMGKLAVVKVQPMEDSSTPSQPAVKHKPAVKGRIAIKQPAKLKVEAVQGASLFPIPPFPGRVKTISEDKISSVRLEPLQGVLGEISISRPTGIRKKEAPDLVPRHQSDSGLSNFAVFPNPVRNASFAIDASKLDAGQYDLHILSSTGEIVQANEVVIDKGKRTQQVKVQPMTAGPYFIRLTNKTKTKVYTEIIIIQ
jgi:hypothetical protein